MSAEVRTTRTLGAIAKVFLFRKIGKMDSKMWIDDRMKKKKKRTGKLLK